MLLTDCVKVCSVIIRGNKMTDSLNNIEYRYVHIEEYLQLLDSIVIRKFLKKDSCCILADRYILAIVFTFFTRAQFSINELTSYNFFVALHLAHDLEEDNEDLKSVIILAANAYTNQGINSQEFLQQFLRRKDALWERMKYRTLVSLKCCLKVIQMQPDHPVWQRFRAEVHAGATRGYDSPLMRGASEINDVCYHCHKFQTDCAEE